MTSPAGGHLHTAGAWRFVPAAAGHAEPGHGRFKPPAPWHVGMRRGDAHSPMAPCRAAPHHVGHRRLTAGKMFSSACFAELWDSWDWRKSTRHTFSSSEGAGPQNVPVTRAGSCRGRALLPWCPGMVHSSTPTLRRGTQKCTELSPANAATLAHWLYLPSYVAIGTTAPASAPAPPCHASSAPHWAQPTSASLPACLIMPPPHSRTPCLILSFG